MRINTNISALRASNNLNKTNKNLTKSLERLSSGYRLNRASDDAAGMAISQKMKTQIAGLEQANQNASDGISLIQTAEGALAEVQNMAQRIRELSVQAANGTNTPDDRAAIQAEIDELTEEISRISTTTEFNTLTLLNGGCDRKSFSNLPEVSLISTSDTVAVGNYNMVITQDARQAVLYGATIGNLDGATITDDQKGTININGVDIVIEKGDTMQTVFGKLREGCEKANVNVISTDGTKNGKDSEAGYTVTELSATSKLVFISKEYGSSQEISIHCDNNQLAGLLGINPSGVKTYGSDVKANLVHEDNGFKRTATCETTGNKITVTDSNGFKMVVEAESLGTKFKDPTTLVGGDATVDTALTADQGKVSLSVLSAGSLKFQVGANEGQIVEVAIPKIDPKTLGIDNINVETEKGAQEAIAACDVAITRISEVRSKLGAYQNRLEHTVANLEVSNQNMTEALSRIMDTDMAAEMATYTQNNVLVQAGSAMLAQANQRPEQILSLLNA